MVMDHLRDVKAEAFTVSSFALDTLYSSQSEYKLLSFASISDVIQRLKN